MSSRIFFRLLALASVSAFAQEGAPAPAEAPTTVAAEPAANVTPPPASLLPERSAPEAPTELPAAPVAALAQDKGTVPVAQPAPASEAARLETPPVAPAAPTGVKRTAAVAKRKNPKVASRKSGNGSRVAKKKVGRGSRLPASVDDAVQVFDESTSFETMVREKKQSARDPAAFAPSARVIAVRRELGLTTAEANSAPQDIVLNAGTDSGLDEGMVLSVARSIPILDPYKENQQKQLEVEFARIRIVHAQPTLAIARLEKLTPIRTGLAVGTRAVLIGDYVGQFTK